MWHEKDHRRFVGDKKMYDIMGAYQFITLFQLGLREKHSLLDIGCGSLRAGRFFIQYLSEGNYYGTEPNSWLVQKAISEEIGRDMISLRFPFFFYDENFDFSIFKKNDFDFILAHSIFSHAGVNQVEKCIGEVKKILNKTGIFIFTFCLGEKNNSKLEWTYPGKVQYTLTFIKSLLKKYGMVGSKMNFNAPGKQTWIKAIRK